MFRFSITPANDLRKNRRAGLWEVTGSDPSFALESRAATLPAGRYWVKAPGGQQLEHLSGGAFYVDTGSGFNEAEKVPFAFVKRDDGSVLGILRLARETKRLRYDPTDSADSATFALESITLEPVEAAAQTSDPRMTKLLINLVRLMPSNAGAGGAGRFAHALLEYLPASMQVRCTIAAHSAALSVQFPAVDFFICPDDENQHLAEHLAWCDCYLDPLNALRPKMIDPSVPVIGMVLDLQHMQMPWLFSDEELAARRREYRYSISRSDHLIAISHYERSNLETFYGRRDVTVAHLSGFMAEAIEARRGADQRAARRTSNKRENTAPYLIYPAVPWPHKNHEALIQAIALLKRRALRVPLVLTNAGGQSPGSERIADCIRMMDVGDLVDRKAYLPEEELHQLFEMAAGLVFPSLYEGFGIPLVDALKMGVPVLAAQNSAAEEIGQHACAYFSNARNALAIARDIENFWTNGELRKELIDRGRSRGADFQSRKMADNICSAVTLAIEAHSNRHGIREPAVELQPPRYNDLHLMLIVDEAGAALLAEIPIGEDINQFLTARLGTPHITLCVDIILLDDEALRAKLEGAHNLTVFDAIKPEALDFAVHDFELRYNTGQFSIVTSLGSLDVAAGTRIRAMYDLLHLEPQSGAARCEGTRVDAQVLPIPDEVDGIIAFERQRRGHFAVLDVMFKRSMMSGLKNGTAAFLSQYTTKISVVSVPVSRG